ncbi:MAG: aldo/keto reductase, partial [Pseudomonadales bacterium]|nr:aldo/keto reductase [Pseudomonadales bacterium]
MADVQQSDKPKVGLRQLGQTDIRLSPIGLGTWQFSSGIGNLGKFWDPLETATMTGIVKTALDSGVNWFDTAESYGDGASENNLSDALKSLDIAPGEVVIADKWWPKQRKALSIVESIDERLTRLQGFPIDLYQIHWPESESWLRTEMKMLAQLVDEGKVRAVGLCNYNRRDLKRAHRYLRKRGIPLASIQVRYSLAHRA